MAASAASRRSPRPPNARRPPARSRPSCRGWPGWPRRRIRHSAASACAHLPARLHPALAAVRDLALGRGAGEGGTLQAEGGGTRQTGEGGGGTRSAGEGAAGSQARDEFVVRFQQTCGPVMAKGVEDTAFYRWSRLVALNEVGGDPDKFGMSPQEFHGGQRRFAPVAETAKREAATRTFAAELSRLARLAQAADQALGRLSTDDVRVILVELLTALGVYRAYVVPGEPAPETHAALLDNTAASACAHLPARLHPALAAVRDLALGRGAGEGGTLQAEGGGTRQTGEGGGGTRSAGEGAAGSQARDEFVVRFQQTCGPVMAKGVEDTAFYRWSRLVALNEVGGDPDKFGMSPQEFHDFAGRLARDWPATMTTLSTHDTKRQEDVRARLAALAESPELWTAELARWHDRAAQLSGGRLPEPDTEYLLWQALAGAWPAGRERIAQYLRKAMREAKTSTSWTDPNPEYEATVLGFADLIPNDTYLTTAITRFLTRIREQVRANSLGAKSVQLTMPGVADVYQGCELTGLSLVDPDNRRPVAFERRRCMLARLDEAAERAAPAADDGLDLDKLLVTSRALRLRRAHPEWFRGCYEPVWAEGPAAHHVIAFARGTPAPRGSAAGDTTPRGSAPGVSGPGGSAVTVAPRL